MSLLDRGMLLANRWCPRQWTSRAFGRTLPPCTSCAMHCILLATVLTDEQVLTLIGDADGPSR